MSSMNFDGTSKCVCFTGMKGAVSTRIGLCLGVLTLLVSCTKKNPEAVASAPQPSASATHAAAAPQPREVAATPDVCTLLTAEEISAIQGEAFKAAKPSSSSRPG